VRTNAAPAPTASPAGDAPNYELHVGRREAAPDGRPRQIMCYDGQLPGPVIRAKLGQKLRVRVVNELDVPTTVHWHGMHQPGTWQMDGVAYLSQPPIAPGAEFTYEFTAAPAGTHWYHAHLGPQYGNGLFGPLIIEEHQPPAEYDREEVLFINDWFLEPTEKILQSLLAGTMSDDMPLDGAKAGEQGPVGSAVRTNGAPATPTTPAGEKADAKAMTMKGRAMAGMKMGGAPDIGDVPFESALINGRGRGPGHEASPLSSLAVKPGEKLRLRLINGSTTYAFRFRVDGHSLVVIASDGAPLAPVEVDNLLVNIGERYDVLLEATGQRSAWIRAATLAGNAALAVLRYPGASDPAPSPVDWGSRTLEPAQMKSPVPPKLAEDPREVRLKLGGSMKPYRWDLGGQSYPKADPISLQADEPVRFVLENPTGMDHPFHLHGHYFSVLGPPDALNTTDPPQKDTVNVPAGTTLVLQWQATNPGRWFFHCHIEWHAATGMARVIDIAQR
jgi:FtsP/CotA-like multicopper oxidase with cupredoxin domain